jgi:hypothetical protein
MEEKILNETFLVMSICSTLLFFISETMGYMGLKHKSITSFLLSIVGCGECAKKKLKQRETLERDRRLHDQVEEEIRLSELREVMVPKTGSGSIIVRDSTDRRPSLVTIESGGSTSGLDERRSSGQTSIILKGNLNKQDSLFYTLPAITLESATPLPGDYSSKSPRFPSLRSYSAPVHSSSGRVIFVNSTASASWLYPLLVSQNDASDSAEDSDT